MQDTLRRVRSGAVARGRRRLAENHPLPVGLRAGLGAIVLRAKQLAAATGQGHKGQQVAVRSLSPRDAAVGQSVQEAILSVRVMLQRRRVVRIQSSARRRVLF